MIEANSIDNAKKVKYGNYNKSLTKSFNSLSLLHKTQKFPDTKQFTPAMNKNSKLVSVASVEHLVPNMKGYSPALSKPLKSSQSAAGLEPIRQNSLLM